jgi:subtilisin-like proprotein convertase family protein
VNLCQPTHPGWLAFVRRAALPLLWLSGGSGGLPASSPVILFQPVEQRAISGGRTELGVNAQAAAGDNGKLTYQWLRNGEAVPGAVNRLIIFAPVRVGDAGTYQVIVRGSAGETWSRPADLHVLEEPPAPGSLDPSFAAARIENPSGGVRGTVYAVASTADGGVLIGGDFTLVDGVARPGLAKLTATGELDSPFVFTGLPSQPVVRCLATVPGGWLAGGSASTLRKSWLAFVPAAGGAVANMENGWSFSAAGGQEVRALLPVPDGRTLAAGTFTASAGAYSATRLMRLKPDGTLDPSLPAAGWNAGVLSLALTPAGNILAGGAFSTPKRCLARLLPDGAHDGSFAIPASGWSAAAEISALAVLTNSRIVAGGKFSFAPAGSFTRWSLAGFMADGTPDLTFAARLNTDGKAEVRALLADGPDKVLVAGRFTEVTDADAGGGTFKVPWAGVVRLNSGGRPVYPQRSTAWDDRTVWSLGISSPPDKPRRVMAGGDFAWPAERLTALRGDAPANAAPVILSDPVPSEAVIRAGDPLRISVAATGWPEPTWQWHRDGQPVAGARSPELFLPNAGVSDTGHYTLRISNSAGSVTSAPVHVAVHESPPGFAPLVTGISAMPLTVQEFTSNLASVRLTVPFAPTRIAVALRISHRDTNDLSATLIAPGGQRARVFDQPDPSGRDFADTVFDDTSTLRLEDALPPFRGTYQTGGALNALRALPATGDWFLEVTNNGGQTAVLESWKLMVEGPAAPVTYESWRDAALAGAENTAPEQDADGDGTSNAGAWLFGAAPCNPGTAPGGIRGISSAPDGSCFLRWHGWQSAAYQLEWSADLLAWRPAVEGPDYVTTWTTRTEPARCEYTVRLTTPAAAGFWRLRGR